MYQEPKNNPSIPTEQRQIYSARMDEKGPRQPPNPIINFQYYPPPRPQKEIPKGPDPTTLMPMYAPNPFMPPQMGYTFQHPFLPTPSFPIMKNYEINGNGPNGNHEVMHMIYEDVLPSKALYGSLNTLSERLTIYNFIRSIIFSNSDGADISLTGEANSLLSHVRFDELNPYNTYKFSLNPYRGLPDDFLLYRSCYPIRHNQSGGNIICAKESTGVNIRIYKMTEGSFMVNRSDKKKFPEYNEWREIAYYEYLREQLMKNKMSPNFVNMFGYFISEKSKIDFDKINALRNNKKDQKQPATLVIDDDDENGVASLPRKLDELTKDLYYRRLPGSARPVAKETKPDTIEYAELGSVVGPHANISMNSQVKYVNKDNKIIIANPDAYLGKALIVLTESPTYNLFGWASKTYQKDGNIKRMINRGIHTEQEWFSVLFQLMSALYAMQIMGICIDNFSVEHNVYIKDLSLRGSVTNFWKYKIDNIDYYVPNHGYLVMIDSNFVDRKDISEPQTLIKSASATSQTKKLDGKFMGEYCTLTSDEITNKTFNMFVNSVDPNIFSSDFLANGGCKPPDTVIRILSDITTLAKSSDSSKDIGHYFIHFMNKYVHNRIGTYLKEGEIANIRREDKRDFIKGQIVVYEAGYGAFKFALYLSVNAGNASILSKTTPEDKDYITENVAITSLHNYSKAEPILQTFKPTEASLNEDDLLETYIIKP